MWKRIIRHRLRKRAPHHSVINTSDIERSSTILFSVFSRYGDSIIAYKIIDEFIARYPKKRYIVITSNPTIPYAKAIIKKDVEIHSVNLRKNPLKFLEVIFMLKKIKIDLGFNPWSHGEDSEFFATFAEKFLFYNKFHDYAKEFNLYKRAREYLLLEKDNVLNLQGPSLDNVRNILISPFSTDITKSLRPDDLGALIKQVYSRFPDATIMVALQKKEIAKVDRSIKQFIFQKNRAQSEEFLALLTSMDLFISVDAGPLHLADALGVRVLGIFGPTAPETILDSDSRVMTVRHAGLKSFFCFVRECRDPLCIHKLFEGNVFDQILTTVHSCNKLTLETVKCKILC